MYLSDLWDLRSLTKRLYGQRIQPVCEAYGLTRMEMDILLFLANMCRRRWRSWNGVVICGASSGRGTEKRCTWPSVRGRNRRYAQDRRPRGRFLQPCSWDSRKRNGCAWGRP